MSVNPSQTDGVALIAAEREHQIRKGYDAEHDDSEANSQLVHAAEALLTNNRYHWPWDNASWSDGDDRIVRLAKAGALIAAEIERLGRAR